jgi:hypothetical protein
VSPDCHPLSGRELAGAGRALFGVRWREELAAVLGCAESFVADVEKGVVQAPATWRGLIIALAQDTALRALETASNLLLSEADARLPAPAAPEARYV